ncbi:putative response regulator receiver protein [Selenomonas ruminantium subsp. lactilytica TAM6421]|uniref:Putative response regulator receiver protein n=1 Tax=Selenomonas ruminantium subsp. lactilytica (strain NBRC 103574 / TAM6421) TaxID=927704 RepID=I0GT91_SELRL|nr:putative response regulator receiver protein [Selenomonas ruminantium subsp. lactilytica TAM6421]
MVVDGSESDRQKLHQILDPRVQLQEAKSGMEALTYVVQHHVDLMLLASKLPDMDGFEVLRRLNLEPRFKDLPIIVTTHEHSQKAEAAVAMAGGFDIIRKPFVPIIVVKKVEQVLEMEYLHRNLKKEVHRQTKLAEDRLASSERLFEETVMALAKTIDAKDAYTRGHSQRVARYARHIAFKLGWLEEEQRKIYFMGLLHDIGKIGVPEAIINKTARLTDEEYSKIKQHTVIGSEILELVAEFPELAIGARSHHERYDGKGYPDGFAGSRIPIYARVIAVADAYDAMTSKRSYRGVLPQDVVRGEIAKGRGTQFDPQFADVMLQIIDEDEEYILHER